jgi:hypothetical protein
MSTGLALINQDFTADEIVKVMEKMSDVVSKARVVALRGTAPDDWTDQGGKPYLTISGSNKVKNIFGVSVSDSSWEKTMMEDDNGKYYIISFSATFTWKLGSTTMTGTCSSRDKFFGKDKQMQDVDFTNVLKKAETNCYGRGIKALLGLTNLTWDSLQEITGFGRDRVTKVEYRDKSVVTDVMKAKQEELRSLILKQTNNDPESAKALLELMTEFVGNDGNKVAGKKEIAKLSEKQLDICIRKMKEVK